MKLNVRNLSPPYSEEEKFDVRKFIQFHQRVRQEATGRTLSSSSLDFEQIKYKNKENFYTKTEKIINYGQKAELFAVLKTIICIIFSPQRAV